MMKNHQNLDSTTFFQMAMDMVWYQKCRKLSPWRFLRSRRPRPNRHFLRRSMWILNFGYLKNGDYIIRFNFFRINPLYVSLFYWWDTCILSITVKMMSVFHVESVSDWIIMWVFLIQSVYPYSCRLSDKSCHGDLIGDQWDPFPFGTCKRRATHAAQNWL